MTSGALGSWRCQQVISMVILRRYRVPPRVAVWPLDRVIPAVIPVELDFFGLFLTLSGALGHYRCQQVIPMVLLGRYLVPPRLAVWPLVTTLITARPIATLQWLGPFLTVLGVTLICLFHREIPHLSRGVYRALVRLTALLADMMCPMETRALLFGL